MGPKIQAAVVFVEQGGERAIVCRPEGVVEALEGRGGIQILFPYFLKWIRKIPIFFKKPPGGSTPDY